MAKRESTSERMIREFDALMALPPDVQRLFQERVMQMCLPPGHMEQINELQRAINAQDSAYMETVSVRPEDS